MAVKKPGISIPVWPRIKVVIQKSSQYIVSISEKFIADFGFQRAGSLAYSTLISLIPIAALSFTLLSSFPFFRNSLEAIKGRLFQHLIPAQIDIIQKYVEDFAHNMSSLNTLSIIAFLFLGLLLMNNFKNHLNAIWKIKSKGMFFKSLTRFWTILTLGPILLGVSFYITNNIGVIGLLERHPSLSIIASFSVNLIFMFLLFFITPDIPVKIRAAFTGAVFSGFFFEVAKNLFTRYSGMLFQTQAQIYKSLAVLPLFLLWIYLLWVIILLGAEISWFVQFPPHLKTPGQTIDRSFARKLSLFLLIVKLYLEDEVKLDKSTLMKKYPEISSAELNHNLQILLQHKLILFTDKRGYIPYTEPARQKLSQIIITLMEIEDSEVGQVELTQILSKLQVLIKKEFKEDLLDIYPNQRA